MVLLELRIDMNSLKWQSPVFMNINSSQLGTESMNTGTIWTSVFLRRISLVIVAVIFLTLRGMAVAWAISV